MFDVWTVGILDILHFFNAWNPAAGGNATIEVLKARFVGGGEWYLPGFLQVSRQGSSSKLTTFCVAAVICVYISPFHRSLLSCRWCGVENFPPPHVQK